ncbi:hypothetical protein [Winogradskyella schleiferi]|uniref:hypothetical protein n=1 Tax=Winogradskyella schleiferi TaxID=2686078 RepID=UPI0015B81008|nr:hypothetical protein [Winogradskyella schleiferi]
MNRLVLKTIIIVSVLLSCYSCKNDKTKTTMTSEIKLQGLTLNNNEKWVANEETHMGMQRIDSILKNNVLNDGKTLGKALSKQTSYIIKSCDMTGDAHDQLHIVLVPILEEISEIKDIKSTSVLEKKVTTLQNLIETYFNYFKI